jgi:hypothetical protein
MGYSNAIYYINLVSGSDAARTALTGCVASNPSGTTIRINKTGHGLVTGAIVVLSGFDTYLNDVWKISVVDADNFDLDIAVWNIATVDNNGTVTPRGGSSWTDGWLTISSGPTAAKTQLGDTIRISKTDDPVPLGDADWTNLSKTVTLSTPPPLQVIDLVDSAFTMANTATSQTTTSRKQGTLAAGLYKSTSIVANTLYGYRNLGVTLNLSAYDAITLWVGAITSFVSTQWKVCLCSDTAGATVVDTFEIPAVSPGIGTSGGWRALVLTRSGGGALGSSIRSIAIYTGSNPTSTSSSSTIYLDCVLACVSTGLTLRSLVSKNSAAYGGAEVWYPIQSVSGSTILLDASTNTLATSGRGYYGVTETTSSYYRNTFVQGPSITSVTPVNTINEGGTAAYPIIYSGGWNTGSNVQDGDTFLDGLNSYGYGIYLSSKEHLIFERISAVRFYSGYYLTASPRNQLNIPNLIGCGDWAYVGGGRNIVNVTNINSNAGGLELGSSGIATVQKIESNISYGIGNGPPDYNCVISASSISNNGLYGVYQTGGGRHKLTVDTASDNGTAAVFNSAGELYLFDSQLNGTEFAGATTGYDSRVYSNNHDRSGYSWIYTDGGTINNQATTFASGFGAEWRLTINSSTRTSRYPLKLPVAQCAVNSGSLVVINATMKKSHATDVDGRLVIPGGRLLGIPTNVTASLANNTDEQTLQVTCTPFVSGVLEVEVWAEYVNNTGTVFVDEITVAL